MRLSCGIPERYVLRMQPIDSLNLLGAPGKLPRSGRFCAARLVVPRRWSPGTWSFSGSCHEPLDKAYRRDHRDTVTNLRCSAGLL